MSAKQANIVPMSMAITTFDNRRGLELVLKRIKAQTVLPAAVIICDDGSSLYNQDGLDRYLEFSLIVFCWQPNRKCRAARIKNFGLVQANDRQIIFVGGDCLMPLSFVEMHHHLYCDNALIS